MDVIGPLSTAPFSRSILGASGFRISGIPNSEFRMAYARSGIPHHDTGKVAGYVTGWDMECLTLECYANNLAEGKGGHEGRGGPLRKGKRAGRWTLSGQRKSP
jgi:hypothetical protein